MWIGVGSFCAVGGRPPENLVIWSGAWNAASFLREKGSSPPSPSPPIAPKNGMLHLGKCGRRRSLGTAPSPGTAHSPVDSRSGTVQPRRPGLHWIGEASMPCLGEGFAKGAGGMEPGVLFCSCIEIRRRRACSAPWRGSGFQGGTGHSVLGGVGNALGPGLTRRHSQPAPHWCMPSE